MTPLLDQPTLSRYRAEATAEAQEDCGFGPECTSCLAHRVLALLDHATAQEQRIAELEAAHRRELTEAERRIIEVSISTDE